jgi:hypothetical protein
MEETQSKKKVVYTIIEKPGRKTWFMKIGTAWLNQDQSWNVYLDAIPFDRKLNIRDEDTRPRFAPNEPSTSTMTQPSFDLPGSIQ